MTISNMDGTPSNHLSRKNSKVLEGFNRAIIGFCIKTNKVCYSLDKMVEILTKEDMSRSEATDYILQHTRANEKVIIIK